MTAIKRTPHLFLSTTHACSYLPHQTASTLFIDPRFPVTPALLGDFNRRGFRRSGDLIYRPHCPGCQACIPVRIPVETFVPSRAQRRTMAYNGDLVVSAHPAGFDAEHFTLFLRYQDIRHTGGTMANPDPATYLRFLVGRHSATTFHEFRHEGALAGVAVVDELPDGLSAVYTFYDPSLIRRGLGTYAILWQIAEARRRGLPFLYLGYWVKDSDKMAYKARFRPLEAYRNGRWSPLDGHLHPVVA
ncbi:arginyltransferase [Acidiferrobacter sp.]|uniref:arginyltransferase n=1 Tax=Acidiferrobacter sp. TaxID=1872107 RepID=UPI0026336127|nr:arginyltransferase [Acidiferrobacter sp.]